MIVYADREQRVRTRTLVRQIIEAEPVESLIRLGQLEAGVVDALCPDLDDLHPVAESLRRIALDESPVAALCSLALPDEIVCRTPEGYAFYSLYPSQYERAAVRFADEHRPAACVVLGIRSIGTGLSAIVANKLREGGSRVWSWTVRPHGHPFNRTLRLSNALALRLREHIDAWFCIVDEGPGLSGSSFAAVAETLSNSGVPDERIVLFPSHQPDVPSLLNEDARNRFARHAIYVEPFPRESVIPPGARDMSGGLWRDVVGCKTPVQPQHERRKYLHRDQLWKFAGLAHLGRERFERGQILTDAKFIPPVLEFRDGFIVSKFFRKCELPLQELLDIIVRYVVFLRQEFATVQPIRYRGLIEMVRVNSGIELPASDGVIEDGVAVAVDGRMLPCEWAGAAKTDALDHYDDHFFPGCQDIAWDIAGAAVEMKLSADALLERYLSLQPDTTLRRRMPFYRTAYLAYRIGYTDMAAQALAGTADGARFADLKEYYTAALAVGPTNSRA